MVGKTRTVSPLDLYSGKYVKKWSMETQRGKKFSSTYFQLFFSQYPTWQTFKLAFHDATAKRSARLAVTLWHTKQLLPTTNSTLSGVRSSCSPLQTAHSLAYEAAAPHYKQHTLWHTKQLLPTTNSPLSGIRSSCSPLQTAQTYLV